MPWPRRSRHRTARPWYAGYPATRGVAPRAARARPPCHRRRAARLRRRPPAQRLAADDLRHARAARGARHGAPRPARRDDAVRPAHGLPPPPRSARAAARSRTSTPSWTPRSSSAPPPATASSTSASRPSCTAAARHAAPPPRRSARTRDRSARVFVTDACCPVTCASPASSPMKGSYAPPASSPMEGLCGFRNSRARNTQDPLLERAIHELAARQHGVVGLRDLVALGLSAPAVRARVAAGRLHRLHHGVFAVAHPRLLTRRGRFMAAVVAAATTRCSHIAAARRSTSCDSP